MGQTRITRDWYDTLMTRLAEHAQRIAKRDMPSLTLRSGTVIKRPGRDTAKVHVPHYWAEYVHDGSAPVSDKLMVWFKNPKLDPRNKPSYPVRYRDRRKLTPDQFRDASRRGLIVVAFRRAAREGTPFFDNDGNMRLFLDLARRQIDADFSTLVKREFRDLGVPTPLVFR